MITQNLVTQETTLYLINGRWCEVNNCYGIGPEQTFGKITQTIVADACVTYCLYGDDLCWDVLLYRVNNKWGLLLKTEITGQGCCNYQSTADNPFIYDKFRILVEGNAMEGDCEEQGEAFYADKRGYIAVQQNNKWGIIRIYKKSWVPILEQLVVPCKYTSIAAAIEQIPPIGTNHQKQQYLRKWYTPSHITRLKQNQIFVFGSNLQGSHSGGAAQFAMLHFEAKMGEGVGRTGQCYAIPTMHGSIDDIKPYVDVFIQYAAAHPELEFLVTPIGCGIAGFAERDMAKLFVSALQHGNIILPESFVTAIVS